MTQAESASGGPCKEATEAATKIFCAALSIERIAVEVQSAFDARDQRMGVRELVNAAKVTSDVTWSYTRQAQKRVEDAVKRWESANAT